MGLASFRLYCDGSYVKRKIFPLGPTLDKESVKRLKPGESIVCTILLREYYGDLKPGRYELKVSYEIPENSNLSSKYGLTPMSFEYKMYNQVTEAKK